MDGCGAVLGKYLLGNVRANLRAENKKQLQTKNGKISGYTKTKPKDNDFSVPIINLSSFEDLNTKELRFGLDHCYVKKNRFTRRDIGLELEKLAAEVDPEMHPYFFLFFPLIYLGANTSKSLNLM